MENLTALQMKKEIISLTEKLFLEGIDHFNLQGKTPQVRFDIRGNTAGQFRRSENAIRYNFGIIEQNYEKFLARTVAHETAHAIQYKISYSAKPHGLEWKRVMRFFGVPSTRCHNYDMSGISSTRRTIQKFPHKCTCKENNIHMVGKKVHTKIQMGAKYTCRKCRSILK